MAKLIKEQDRGNFVDLGYYLAFRYREANPYDTSPIRVDVAGESEQDVQDFFSSHKDVLRKFGVIADGETPNLNPDMFLELKDLQNLEETFANFKNTFGTIPWPVMNVVLSTEDLEILKSTFKKIFGETPKLSQALTKNVYATSLPRTNKEFETLIKASGCEPVDVTENLRAAFLYYDPRVPEKLIPVMKEQFGQVKKLLEGGKKVGYFTNRYAEHKLNISQGFSEFFSIAFFLKYGISLIGTNGVTGLNSHWVRMTPRGEWSLLEERIKFHTEYPGFALFYKMSMPFVVQLIPEKVKKDVRLFYFDIDEFLGGSQPQVYMKTRDVASIDFMGTGIKQYFRMDGKTVEEIKEGHDKFLRCACYLEENLGSSVQSLISFKDCIVFTDSSKKTTYFGWSPSGVNVEAEVAMVPLTDYEVDPILDTFTQEDFAHLYPLSFLSDYKEQCSRPDSVLSKSIMNLVRGGFTKPIEYTEFNESTGVDVFSLLAQSNDPQQERIMFNSCIQNELVDPVSLLINSSTQKTFREVMEPRMLALFPVSKVRELGYLSAFGGFVNGLTEPLKLSESKLKDRVENT